MKRIGVMSDSHGRVPKQVYEFFKDTDIILHCGDIGSDEVLEELRLFKPTIAVWGNCDNRYELNDVKEFQIFTLENLRLMMTHIGGYPKHYNPSLIKRFRDEKPDIFLCGHSHILRVMYDRDFDFLLINPGACGKMGIHNKCTLVRLALDKGKAKDLEVMDFSKY
ncbi:MAG TPA: YfcE family phosphodiesterase [Candidatus Onthomorpha intestinigallinarum]|uniref:Phosphoesterase n=1 Tax=Candidatus Onthomorpha intestinigallinarum TaxID=2840880 RepID=A0A9D1RJ91_9BACT|nr:YfcE family phosphodiesterase [Candidatus Onthomorpha intestinigallinarum]